MITEAMKEELDAYHIDLEDMDKDWIKKFDIAKDVTTVDEWTALEEYFERPLGYDEALDLIRFIWIEWDLSGLEFYPNSDGTVDEWIESKRPAMEAVAKLVHEDPRSDYGAKSNNQILVEDGVARWVQVEQEETIRFEKTYCVTFKIEFDGIVEAVDEFEAKRLAREQLESVYGSYIADEACIEECEEI